MNAVAVFQAKRKLFTHISLHRLLHLHNLTLMSFALTFCPSDNYVYFLELLGHEACVSNYSNNLRATEVLDGVSLKVWWQLYDHVAICANKYGSDDLCSSTLGPEVVSNAFLSLQKLITPPDTCSC